MKQTGSTTGEFLGMGFLIWVVLAWFTHVFVCLSTAKWGFLIAGALVFPIAWVHGTGIWLGVW